MWPKPRLVLLTLIALTTTPLYAHDIYSGLTTKRGASCCDDHDCRPAHFRMTSAGVEMFVLGKWLPIREYAIQYRTLPGDTGETGGAHWCGKEFPGFGSLTYCAVMPPSSASVAISGLKNSN
jgi:hypothetical protein